MSRMAARATSSIAPSMPLGPRVSPAITTRLVVHSVSQATPISLGAKPCFAPWRKNRSTTSSEMRSQTLSGCPSDTLSLVKRWLPRIAEAPSLCLESAPSGKESAGGQPTRRLEDKARQILVLCQPVDTLVNIGCVDHDGFAGAIGGGEADFVHDALHHRMQAAGADVFHAGVHLGGDIRDCGNGVGGEVEPHAFGFHQRGVLFDEADFGLGEDALEVVAAQRLQLHANGLPSLKLRQQVR